MTNCINCKYSMIPKVHNIKLRRWENRNYLRTKHGTIYKIYKSQVVRSIRKGFNPPSYTHEELREWMIKQDVFHEIYNQWVASGYKTMLCVSCDRDDRFKEYSLDNITIRTWQDNFDRYMKHRLGHGKITFEENF